MSKKINLKWVFIIFWLGLAAFASAGIVISRYKSTKINNYDECVKAGNPVMQTYPETCKDGARTFVNN